MPHERSFLPIRCCRNAAGTPEGLAGKPQNGDCTNVAAYQDCRIRGPRHRQSVDQFPSTKAASTYYSQAKAKYAKCKDFTESVPASSIPGSGKMETTLMTMSKTKVGKYQAFQLTQAVTFSDSPAFR